METINKEVLKKWLEKANTENNMYDYLTKIVKLSPEKATEIETTFHDAIENPDAYTTLSPDDNWDKDSLSLAILYITEDILLIKENTQASLESLREEDWFIKVS